MSRSMTSLVAGLVMCAVLSGCSTVYYSAWEQLGKHKRDLLREFVVEARDEQKEASEQFKDALTRLRELYKFDGGNLEKTYDSLKAQYDRSASRADAVRERIGKVEKVAADLFKEWESELATITNARLRDDSKQKLRDTQSKFSELQSSMRRAEQSMAPVLTQLRDQVTYLKHNLNAQAIGALRGEAVDIEKEIQQLIQELNSSISQADTFIKALPAE